MATSLKYVAFSILVLVSIAATSAFYGWLEASANLVEGLGKLFAPGATTVIFSPFIMLMILLIFGVFVAVPLLAVSVTAALVAVQQRCCAQTLSLNLGRNLILIAAVSQFVIIFLSANHDVWFITGRPAVHPTVPTFALALLASANTAFSLIVGLLLVRKLSA